MTPRRRRLGVWLLPTSSVVAHLEPASRAAVRRVSIAWARSPAPADVVAFINVVKPAIVARARGALGAAAVALEIG